MNPISRWLQRSRLDRELAEEMQAHLTEKVDQLMDEGQSEAEALSNARRQFGNLTLQQETSRETWGWNFMEELVRDVRFAWRVLSSAPAFTITVVLVLALGIGMNTAMFSVVKAVLLSQLPYPDPDSLVDLRQVNKDGRLMNASGPDFRDWRDQNHSMQHIASYDGDTVTLSGKFAPERMRIGVVSSGFFETLGVPAITGRTFTPDEQKPGGAPAVVLGYGQAQRISGSGAAAIGKTVRIDGMAFVVVGIMPPDFDFPFRAEAWIPQEFFGDESARSAHNYRVVGRLKPGVSIRQAQNDMNVIAAALAKAYVDDKDQGIRVGSLHEEIVGSVRPSLMILLGAVGLVLLIACVNISNLHLARSTVRVKELALRTALGAGRGRLIRQLLTESVLLSLIGGCAGLFLAIEATALLRDSAPTNIPRIETIHIDAYVLLFTSALSLASGILFGVLPALVGSRTDVNRSLKEGSSMSTAAPGLKRWGNGLVISEIGLAVVLLAGSTLLLRSFWNLSHVDSGLHSSGVFTADISWPVAGAGPLDGNKMLALSKMLLDRLAVIPGVQAVALIQPLPVRNAGSDGDFEIEGQPLPADPHLNPNAFYRLASTDYFRAFGLPILQGRAFAPHDSQTPNQVVIVSRTFAAKFFPGQSPLGKRIRFLGFDAKPQFMTIVGVVPDVHAFGLNKPIDAEVFAEYMQHAGSSLDATLVVRAPGSVQPAVRSVIASVNRDTPINFQNMDDVITGTISRQRFETFLITLFASFALLLAIIGIYGLLSYTVTRRTSELGIRMALGANPGVVLKIVLRDGAMLVAAGLIVGMLCALLLTRTLSSLLFGVTPGDPGSFAATAVLFGVVALLGCYLPGRRASKIDPIVALRYE